MPRSNKKKHPRKPPPKHPSSEEMVKCTSILSKPTTAISKILSQERSTMIKRALHSGKHHGINLKPGSPIPGLGDCAFEAVIQNNK